MFFGGRGRKVKYVFCVLSFFMGAFRESKVEVWLVFRRKFLFFSLFVFVGLWVRYVSVVFRVGFY